MRRGATRWSALGWWDTPPTTTASTSTHTQGLTHTRTRAHTFTLTHTLPGHTIVAVVNFTRIFLFNPHDNSRSQTILKL